MAKKVTPRFRKPPYGRTFIREWRQHRNKTLQQLADAIEMTHASLSRVERGRQPYNQSMLEAIASALQTDVASLLMRNPSDPEAIWSIWEQAKPGVRRQIVEIARTLTKTGT
jgi:transcriptional regulator with XRE-family HTH domain